MEAITGASFPTLTFKTSFNIWGKWAQSMQILSAAALVQSNFRLNVPLSPAWLTSKINEVGKQFGTKHNIKKTSTMVVSKKPNTPKINNGRDGQQIEQLTSYMYLGRLITEDGRSEKEIKRRRMIARTTFTNMRTLLSCRGINLKTRLRAIKYYIWQTLCYVAETWTITKSLLSRLDAFEMWIYRTVLKISWTENITNEEVLRRMGTGR